MKARVWAERAAYAFKTLVLRQHRPWLVGLVITDQCNLNCHYCESKNTGQYRFTWPETCKAVEAAYGRGCRSLYFTGGEPMLWRDGDKAIQDAVSYAQSLGFHEIFIFTNGTFPLNTRGCHFIVTVDGPRAVHERIRPGTYDLILHNVRQAVTKAVFASITLGRQNVDCIEEFAREMVSAGLFRGISFNLLTHWPEMVQRHGIPPADRLAVMDRLWRLKQKGYPIVLSRAAWRALRDNRWKRPIREIQLITNQRVFDCCRDVDNPAICENCGYANCVEVAQILALRPSALWQVLKIVGN
ncbi:MAG TPA: radical SAM protein [Candidatus Paceibacterota bacterium]|nr:radical SAM protein [Verrucomicrobiota bacterium]HSA12657.1 radical SAM protein [Candidatus Paceibacterota bacterium]